MQISIEEVSRALRSQGVAPAKSGRTDGNGHAEATNRPTAASSVEVSGEAQEIQRVKRLVENTPDVREELVQKLKADIESGTYNVTGEDIADLMVRRAFADSVR
jgi:negative regulator of flagellin synthesis FlgM